MRFASDIKEFMEDDVRKLTEALITGELSLRGLSQNYGPEDVDSGLSPCSESDLHRFASDIIRYQLESRMMSLILPYLSTMRWLTLQEACIYARKSRNTLLELIKKAKVYGTKAENGEYVVDRESIDAYYNRERDELKEKLKSLRRVS